MNPENVPQYGLPFCFLYGEFLFSDVEYEILISVCEIQNTNNRTPINNRTSIK